jgi:hypothetical protein
VRTHPFLPTLLACFALVGASRAGITSVTYDSTSDANLYCYANITYNLDHSEGNVSMDGYQYAPGVISGSIFADSPADPSLTIGGSVDNDMGFAWSGYKIRIFMDRVFTLSNVSIGPNPANWTYSVIPPAPGGAPSYYGASQYVATINYSPTSTGLPVAPGGELDFSYKLTFTGSTTYGFTAEMTPVPEPSSIALAGLGIAAFCGIARRRQTRLVK